jgi:hypothetical protein
MMADIIAAEIIITGVEGSFYLGATSLDPTCYWDASRGFLIYGSGRSEVKGEASAHGA